MNQPAAASTTSVFLPLVLVVTLGDDILYEISLSSDLCEDN